MSHQTGIQCDGGLKEVFRDCTNDGNIRSVKVMIDHEHSREALVCAKTIGKEIDNWEEEFDSAVKCHVTEKQPCYILVQLQTKNEWLFISFSPDDAHTKQKMLYAATRSTLKTEFGGSFIKEEFTSNTMSEISLEGYLEYLKLKSAPPPLTQAESHLAYMDEVENEDKAAIGASTRHQTVQGISFPITKDTEQALSNFKAGSINFIEMNVDIDKEIIYQSQAKDVSVCDLENLVSKTTAGYYLFNYNHRYEEKELNTAVFIYVMPGYSIPIKQRMLYSSCKSPLIAAIEQDFAISIKKKLECDDKEQITEGYLRDEVHPPAVVSSRTFSKPKGPGGRRGPARRPKLENGA